MLRRFSGIVILLFGVLCIASIAGFFFVSNFFISGLLIFFSLLGLIASIGTWQLSNGNQTVALFSTLLLLLLSMALILCYFFPVIFLSNWNWFLIGFILLGFGGFFQVISEQSGWLKLPAFFSSLTGLIGIVLSLGWNWYEPIIYTITTLSLILTFVCIGILLVQTSSKRQSDANK
jgi:hypothetical protein